MAIDQSVKKDYAEEVKKAVGADGLQAKKETELVEGDS